MKISVLGVGKVGLPLAIHLAELGHQVKAYDTHQPLRKKLQSNINPLPFEPGINLTAFKISNSLEEAISDVEVITLIVPTPTEGNTLSGKFVEQALNELGQKLTHHTLVVCISTLDPRTAEEVLRPRKNMSIVYNPTMIRLGAVKEDLKNGKVFLFGGDTKDCRIVEKMWQLPDGTKKVFGDFKSIAMAKLAINTSLSAKVAIANDLAARAEFLGADLDVVFAALHGDPRIGSQYFHYGNPPAGPCIFRDQAVLAFIGKETLPLAENIKTWHAQVFQNVIAKGMKFVQKWKPKKVGVLGVVYNPGACDITNSIGLGFAERCKEVAEVVIFDPMAKEVMKGYEGTQFKQIASLQEANNCDVVLIGCMWEEIKDWYEENHSRVNFIPTMVLDWRK
jgi:UDPglucose 6-dehydrogenase